MSDPAAPDRQAGVLISGAFGTGKSSTAEEMAIRHPPLAALVACGA